MGRTLSSTTEVSSYFAGIFCDFFVTRDKIAQKLGE